jgi:hypothetical protein
LLPKGLVRDGTFCSLGTSNLSGSPSVKPQRKASPFSSSPCVLLLKKSLDLLIPQTLGSSLSTAWLSSSFEDAGPSGLSCLSGSPPLRKKSLATDYFFISESQNLLQNPLSSTL